MAVGNTFGATALSSYGGFWIAYGITLTPGGFEILASIKAKEGPSGVNTVLGFWLIVCCPQTALIFNTKIADF